MGTTVLILGHSGSGKSTSLRNFDEGEVGIFNVAGKPLPFRKRLNKADRPLYGTIMGSLQKNAMRAYVIDDANYLMAFENFRKVNEKGFDKFVNMALHFEQLLEAANSTNDDTIVYVLMHPDYDDAGRMKPKTIGKMLDNQLTVEGMFPIVLEAARDEQGLLLRHQVGRHHPGEGPHGHVRGGANRQRPQGRRLRNPRVLGDAPDRGR